MASLYPNDVDTMTTLTREDLAWCVRRMPKDVRELLKDRRGTFLAGGFIRACVAGEEVNDLDLFVASKEEAKAVAARLSDAVDGDLAGTKKVHESANAYTVYLRRALVQVIHRWTFKYPAECMESFDFTIAQAAIWWDGGWESMCSSRFYPDLAAKRLVYLSPSRNEDAGGSMLRVLKFYNRGYRMPLPDLAAVIARLVGGVDEEELKAARFNGSDAGDNERAMGKVLTGLLREVDPLIDPDHIIHEEGLDG